MSAPRRMQAPQIYQDPVPQNQQSTSPIYTLPPHFDAFGPLSELSHNVNVSLNASISTSAVIPPPSQGDFITDSLHKKPVPLMPQMHQSHRPLKPLTEHMPMYHAHAHFDKENVFTPDMMGQNSLYVSKLPMKASFSSEVSASSMSERPPQKKQKRHSINEPTQSPFVLPDPNDLPTIEDDGTKPAYSYSQLIGMAILRSENRRLTLAQIYKWISNNFLFYRSQETGWQNSIRHNLSLNKAFTKQDRPKDDPGKGHYWAIQPGFEAQFLREKSKAGNPNAGLSQATQARRPSTSHPGSSHVGQKALDTSKFPEEDELSSDATIPASDPTVHEGVPPPHAMLPPVKNLRSSPPAEIHSSPPQLAMGLLRERSPPAEHQFAVPANRTNGGRKRKLSNLQSGLGDSGYYSSIESSATRNSRTLMTSEADIEPHTRKRGRAEEEIARIRSSSYDSPSKSRSNPTILVSSSPFCSADGSAPGPATPGIIFKRPMKPPTSVSPNTNLRRHRENVYKLLGSPEKNAATFDPTFDPLLGNMFTADINDAAWLSMLEESPIRSAKRPRLERANTVTGVFADVTSMGYDNRRFLSPSKLFPSPMKMIGSSPLKLGSPLKLPPAIMLNDRDSLGKNGITSGSEENDDFAFALNLPSDESEQIDITQGFHKIGSPSTLMTSASLQPPAQAFAFPVYPGTEENFQSPTKPMRGKPEFSRRATFNL